MAVVWPSKNNFANGDVLTATNMNNIGDTLNVFNPTSATNGQVWIANGSGSGAYGSLSVSTFQSITTSASTSATVTLNVTGNNYRMLTLYSEMTTTTNQIPNVNINGTTTASWYRFSGTEQGGFFNSSSGTPLRYGGTSATTWRAVFNFYRMGPGTTSLWSVWWTATNEVQTMNLAGILNTGVALTSLTVNCSNVNFADHRLYGVLN